MQNDCVSEHETLLWLQPYMPWTAIAHMRAVEKNVWIRWMAPQLQEDTRVILSGLVSTAGAGALYLVGQRYPHFTEMLGTMLKQHRSNVDFQALPRRRPRLGLGYDASTTRQSSLVPYQSAPPSSSDEEESQPQFVCPSPTPRLSILGPNRMRRRRRSEAVCVIERQ
jgi:hypothetical protein